MRRICILLIFAGVLVSCGQPTLSAPLPPKATASPTPFQAELASPTPAAIQAWRSPNLPAELASSLQAMDQLAGRELEWVSDPQAAELRFSAQPDTPVSQWFFVAAVPFASVEDEIDFDTLRQSFTGDGPWRVLADQATMASWQEQWGQPTENALAQTELQAIAESAAEPTLALLPFGSLNPSWKMLAVDGQSIFSPEFAEASYPLTISYGVSGGEDLRLAAAAELKWPRSNFQTDELSTVAITGVTALTRATAWAIARQGVDWATELVAPTLISADITHISHEVAFTQTCPPVNPSRDVSRFCGQPDQIEVLEVVGTDVIELTGNHVNDYGPDALAETLDMYDQRGWQTFGGGRDLASADQPALFEHNGNKFAFLGCNQPGPVFAWATQDSAGALPCDLEALYQQISDLRQAGILPIVTFQWAESYSDWPLPQQAEAFRQAGAAGAVVVSGSQAHRPQGFEFSPNGFIHFGLGNLFFDQMWSLETRQEFIDLYHFYQGELINIELTTWMLENYARVRPMSTEERQQFLSDIFIASGY